MVVSPTARNSKLLDSDKIRYEGIIGVISGIYSDNSLISYRKTPKISPWAYISHMPFLMGLYSGGLIIGGGAYTRG